MLFARGCRPRPWWGGPPAGGQAAGCAEPGIPGEPWQHRAEGRATGLALGMLTVGVAPELWDKGWPLCRQPPELCLHVFGATPGPLHGCYLPA